MSPSGEPEDAPHAVPFMSEAWVEAFDLQLRRLGVTGGDAEPSVIEYVVEGSEVGAYHVIVDPASVRAVAGRAPSPDVRLTQDRETALAVRNGQRSALDAFMSGDLVLSGDAERLRRLTTVMTSIGDASAAIQ